MLEVRDVLWMLVGVVPSHDGTVVTRAVVHEQQFPGLISLGENAQYGVLYESFRIKERNDYGDERLGVHDVQVLAFSSCLGSGSSFDLRRRHRLRWRDSAAKPEPQRGCFYEPVRKR